ncbi:MAG TPA: hydroxyphenylacetyl-CoA thioesterase PaaI [Actinomycetota bacterium]
MIDPLSRLLGLELLDEGPGRATVQGRVSEDHLNPHGMAHGGFIFSLADAALAVASNSHGPDAMAIAATIHFTRSANAGDVLTARAREVSLGGRTATYEIEVVSGEGTPVALFTGTVYRRS